MRIWTQIDGFLFALLIDTEHGGNEFPRKFNRTPLCNNPDCRTIYSHRCENNKANAVFLFDIGYYDWIERSEAGLLLYKNVLSRFTFCISNRQYVQAIQQDTSNGAELRCVCGYLLR